MKIFSLCIKTGFIENMKYPFLFFILLNCIIPSFSNENNYNMTEYKNLKDQAIIRDIDGIVNSILNFKYEKKSKALAITRHKLKYSYFISLWSNSL